MDGVLESVAQFARTHNIKRLVQLCKDFDEGACLDGFCGSAFVESLNLTSF